jgi:hypothetical protein
MVTAIFQEKVLRLYFKGQPYVILQFGVLGQTILQDLVAH